jgi:hypothetical protein
MRQHLTGSALALVAALICSCSTAGEADSTNTEPPTSATATPNTNGTVSTTASDVVMPSASVTASGPASGTAPVVPTGESSTPIASSSAPPVETTNGGTSSAPDDASDDSPGDDAVSDDNSADDESAGEDNANDAGSADTGSTGGAPPTATTTADASAPPDDTDANNDFYPCDGANPADYDVAVTQSGSNYSVTRGGQEVYGGGDFEQALTSAYGALSQGRTSKESILVQGDGALSASSQLSVPSYTILNVCGTIDVTGAASGSDRSPFYARNKSQIDIPNLKLTGAPQYGLFFRQSSDIHLGRIELRLTRDAGIGIRVDAGPDAQSTTDFNRNLTIDYVYGSGMGSHIVETYGIDTIQIGEVEGEDVGECGLLLNRSINAEIGQVSCTDCATDTGYAAFRVANSVGKVGDDFPTGNIHVGKVYARGGGRGIFSVSGCGGLVIDEIDIADTGNTAILMQNTYNTTIAALSGTVSGGLVQLSNDTEDTNEGRYAPTSDVTLQNLMLTNGASVRQDWCNEYGSNGCSATNIVGGDVSMCQ